MKTIQTILLLTCSLVLAATATAQDSPARKEMKRADLSGAPGMEVISSIVEFKPGDEIPRHFHNGVETAYVLQGAMLQLPGKEATLSPTGTVVLNARGFVHGGAKVVGETSYKLFAVHIVDKNKPLYDSQK